MRSENFFHFSFFIFTLTFSGFAGGVTVREYFPSEKTSLGKLGKPEISTVPPGQKLLPSHHGK